MKKVRFYESFSDDFEKNLDHTLSDDYIWVRKDIFSKILSAVIYFLALIFSSIYCGIFLKMRVKNRKILKNLKGGFFIYGNHTQPVGDVFIPALAVFPRRIYTVVSCANYALPIIGKILPFLGALPIKNSLKGMGELNKAIDYRIKMGNPVTIYPEAHVWKYYTKIRPFPETSFKFATKNDTPAISMTVTYKKSKIFKRPKMEVFLDGPFVGQGNSVKEKSVNLRDKIYNTMVERSKNSDCEFVLYRKK